MKYKENFEVSTENINYLLTITHHTILKWATNNNGLVKFA